MRRRVRHLCATAAVLVVGARLATAVASVGDPAGVTTSNGPLADPAAALARWADYPVDADPAPVMLVYGGVEQWPDFPRDAQENNFSNGRWATPSDLPAAPARVEGFRVQPAAATLEVLREVASWEAPADDEDVPRPRPADAVEVTDVRLDRATFRTTRGDRSLPAWRVTFSGSRTPAVVSAVAEFDYPEPIHGPIGGDYYRISPDGLTLTYMFTGAAPGRDDCEAEYSPVVGESETAVAIGELEHPGGHVSLREALGLDEPYFCTFLGYGREVTVRLAAPLGNRAVVAASDGAPLALYVPLVLPPRTVDTSDRPAA